MYVIYNTYIYIRSESLLCYITVIQQLDSIEIGEFVVPWPT